MEFPDDDDGDVLRGLYKKGVNLRRSRSIDFYCYVRSRAVAGEVVKRVERTGFKCDIHDDPDAPTAAKRLSVYCSRRMVPTYSGIVQQQRRLNLLLKRFGTRCDGWGTLVDPLELRSRGPAQKTGHSAR